MLQRSCKKSGTADQRRQAVRLLQDTFAVSQRRACLVLGQHRSAQRQVPRSKEDAERLVQRILELVRQHPRFGYRRVWALLRGKAGASTANAWSDSGDERA